MNQRMRQIASSQIEHLSNEPSVHVGRDVLLEATGHLITSSVSWAVTMYRQDNFPGNKIYPKYIFRCKLYNLITWNLNAL